MYPDGLMLVYDGMIYRTRRKDLLPLLSYDAAMSWNQPIFVADDDIIESEFQVSETKLGFRPGTVLRSQDGEKYYIEGVRKRRVSKHAYRIIQFNDFEAIDVTDAELAFHPTGDEIG